MSIVLILAIACAMFAIGLSVASLLISAHATWVFRHEIPAIARGLPSPSAPWSVRAGGWLSQVGLPRHLRRKRG